MVKSVVIYRHREQQKPEHKEENKMTINLKTLREHRISENREYATYDINGIKASIYKCYSQVSIAPHYSVKVDHKVIATRCTFENAERKICEYINKM